MFPPELRPSLERVLAKAHDNFREFDAEPSGWPHPDERRDALNVQTALRRIGLEVTLSDSYSVWSLVSLNYRAGWLVGAETVDGALGGIITLCEDVNKGWDYAQMSNDWD